MIGYIKNTVHCRAAIIAGYFNAAANDCGICDNCINRHTLFISTEEFKVITSDILQLLCNGPMQLPAIQQQLQHIKKEKLKKVLDYLQAEKKIMVDKEGNIFI
jgi:ATP-dependent DNA helicase RecQ